MALDYVNSTIPLYHNYYDWWIGLDLESCSAFGDEIKNATVNDTDADREFAWMQMYCCSNCSAHPNCMFKFLPYKCSDSNPFGSPWYLQLLYIVAFVSMVTVAAGGNIIVIWIVLAHKRMRTVTNYFLVNLAVADAAISLFNTLFNFFYMMYQNWPFGRIYCKISQFISNATICASVFTFMAIAIDRYVAIIHPLKPRMPAHKIFGVIVAIWVTSVLVALPCIIYGETVVRGQSTLCFFDWPDGQNGTTDFVYSLFLILVNYFVPLTILAVTYARVGCELWGSRYIGEYNTQQAENVKSKRRVVKMMMVVVAIFAVCWLPQHLFFLISNKHTSIATYKHVHHIYLTIYWLAMSNSMYNPIIYCWMNARFRKGFKFVFRWLPCVKYRVVRDSLSHGPGASSMRMSVSEGTKFERNGSMMNTMIESLEDSSYSAGPGTAVAHKDFTPLTRNHHRDEYYPESSVCL